VLSWFVEVTVMIIFELAHDGELYTCRAAKGRANVDLLNDVVTAFYSPEDIRNAKRSLLLEFQSQLTSYSFATKGKLQWLGCVRT